MKYKLKDVRQQQTDIAKEFATKPTMPGSVQPRVALKHEVWRDMEWLFKSQRDLCVTLDTTAKTWRDLKSLDEGGREGTAHRVLIEFISLLRKIILKKIPVSQALHDELVPGLDEKYAPYLTNRNFDELVVRLESPTDTKDRFE